MRESKVEEMSQRLRSAWLDSSLLWQWQRARAGHNATQRNATWRNVILDVLLDIHHSAYWETWLYAKRALHFPLFCVTPLCNTLFFIVIHRRQVVSVAFFLISHQWIDIATNGYPIHCILFFCHRSPQHVSVCEVPCSSSDFIWVRISHG